MEAQIVADNTPQDQNAHVMLAQIMRDIDWVDIEEDRIREVLERPSDFGYFGGNEDMFETWTLGPVIRTRDSGLLEQSNAAMLEEAIEEASDVGAFSHDDWEITGCNHWACGWVDHLSFRAVESDGHTPTNVFRWVTRWFDALSDYPVANEEDYSRREWEYAMEYIADAVNVHKDVPDGWACQIADEMVELPNEQWGYDEDIKEIAQRLGFLACEDCDGDGTVADFDQRIPVPVDPDGDFSARRGYKFARVKCETCNGTGIKPTE